MESRFDENQVLRTLSKEEALEISGAVLHDLLKLFAGYNNVRHIYSNKEHVLPAERLLINFDDEIKNFIIYHHLNKIFDNKLGINVDSLAASTTRDEEENQNFSKISFSINPFFKFFTLEDSSLNTIYYSPLVPKQFEKKSTNKILIDFTRNWDNFISRLKNLNLIQEPEKMFKNSANLFRNPDFALLFLKDYALNYPEDKKLPNSRSLYVHSKLVAAYYSIYKNNKNGKAKFLLIDTAGMSKFLSKIYVQRSKKDLEKGNEDLKIFPTSQFRSASFFMEYVIYALVSTILKIYKLSLANVLFIGAGKAMLLIPSNKNNEEELKEIIKTYNIFLYIFTLGSVFLVHSLSDEFEIKDLNNPVQSPVKKYIQPLFVKAGKLKTKPYYNILNELEEFNENKKIREELFNLSWAGFIVKDKEDITFFLSKLGKIIRNLELKDLVELWELFKELNERMKTVLDDDKIKYLREFENIVLVHNFYDLVQKLTNEKIDSEIQTIIKNKILSNMHIFEIAYFSSLNLEDENLTSNKLGILKVDGNSFGQFFNILISKIDENNFKWIDYAVASEYLDYVVLKLIPSIFSNGKTSIIYSAGDEFIIVGDWIELIGKYLEFLNEKRKILANLTFSGSLILVDKHTPLYEFYPVLEKELEKAKLILKKDLEYPLNPGKDGLIFLGYTYEKDKLENELFSKIQKINDLNIKIGEKITKHTSRIFIITLLLKKLRDSFEKDGEINIEVLYYYERLMKDLYYEKNNLEKELKKTIDEKIKNRYELINLLIEYLNDISIEKLLNNIILNSNKNENNLSLIEEYLNKYSLLILLFKEVEETSENNE